MDQIEGIFISNADVFDIFIKEIKLANKKKKLFALKRKPIFVKCSFICQICRNFNWFNVSVITEEEGFCRFVENLVTKSVEIEKSIDVVEYRMINKSSTDDELRQYLANFKERARGSKGI